MPPAPCKKPEPCWCETHPTNSACDNVPSVTIESKVGLFMLILCALYIAINKLKPKK